MRIGIDISQIAFEQTGVSNFLNTLVENLLRIDKENEYILFFSSMRRSLKSRILDLTLNNKNIQVKAFKYPPVFLDLIWNKLHIIPIEWFIGKVDLFITSDWTEPPSIKAKKITILYDLIIKKYPKETDSKIVRVQARRLNWVKKESNIIICISDSTKNDAIKILGIEEKRLRVVCPGI